MRMLFVAAVTAALFAGSAQAQIRNVEFYHVFDLKTSASKEVIAKAAEEAIKWQITDLETNMPIVQGPPPAEPASFTLGQPQAAPSPLAAILANSPQLAHSPQAAMIGASLGALMQAQGAPAGKVVRCDGAVWTAQFERNVEGMQAMDVTTCLFPYARDGVSGYRLTVYGNDTQVHSGGDMAFRLARFAVRKTIGDGSQWRTKLVANMVANVEKATGAKATYLEGQPALSDPRWPKGAPADPAPAPAAAPVPEVAPAAAAPPAN